MQTEQILLIQNHSALFLIRMCSGRRLRIIGRLLLAALLGFGFIFSITREFSSRNPKQLATSANYKRPEASTANTFSSQPTTLTSATTMTTRRTTTIVSTTTTTATTTTTTTSSSSLYIAPPLTASEKAVIVRYLATEAQLCHRKIKNMAAESQTGVYMVKKSPGNWCPCIPPGLSGRILVNMKDDMTWNEIGGMVGSDVASGGEWQPLHCRSHIRIAIIIPCRDRYSHLRILLRHLIPILKRQLIHFKIFVVEQSQPAIFNKAAMMNIGFLEAEKLYKFDCLMYHDVDLLLEDDRMLMNCGPQPHHYSVVLDKWNYTIQNQYHFGGINSMQKHMFRKVNGFSNIFFGWGKEDDDMSERVRSLWRIYRPPVAVARFSTIKHIKDFANPENSVPKTTMWGESAKYRNKIYDIGLSTLVYSIDDIQNRQLFTFILARINVSESLLQYPNLPSNQYRKMNGVCRDAASILHTVQLSSVSCRLRCDSFSDQSCVGFSHQSLPDPTCTLLRTACRLSTEENAFTYMKLSNVTSVS